ncbi:hypothetical protein NWP22_13025 [Anabaenopsis tanganyikae CS-531]|uniref:Uncharacterized protein n=1 Tax=Anabaenopsis tanganyikae CS-531 TaxID=2785304 RepID=A0ABT6KG50_9CYAN|nr:hypothetical protein [Anabaenopsis tanganyikae]MDH6106780.1 hypothetical protein [Anabaenopsis tanganyikae CS-531]
MQALRSDRLCQLRKSYNSLLTLGYIPFALTDVWRTIGYKI